jgi:phosphoadenosine phosphosulfate reductase
MSKTLDEKITALKTLLADIEANHAPAAFASSFGAEDMVLLNLIAREFSGISIFTLDTGRLPKETLDLMHRTQAKYNIDIALFKPQTSAVQSYVERVGLNGFYDSIENRKSCCHIRKVEPLARALIGKRAWLTGLRREQASSRADLGTSEFDGTHNITKFNPLIDWTNDDVWAYIKANEVPYNTLHDRGYPSIGCEPCTRAVKPCEDPRAGRWWWESKADQKECGLHVAESSNLSGIPKYASAAINVIEKVNV